MLCFELSVVDIAVNDCILVVIGLQVTYADCIVIAEGLFKTDIFFQNGIRTNVQTSLKLCKYILREWCSTF